MPTLPHQWEPHTRYTGTVSGAPVLSVWNGSHPGANFAYLDDGTRRPKLLPLAEQAIVFVSCSHNQGTTAGAPYLGLLKAFVTNIGSRMPYAAVVALTQNPRTAPGLYIEQHATRRFDIVRTAPALGIGVVDTYAAFGADLAAEIESVDGIHPTSAGSLLWAGAILDAIDGTL